MYSVWYINNHRLPAVRKAHAPLRPLLDLLVLKDKICRQVALKDKCIYLRLDTMDSIQTATRYHFFCIFHHGTVNVITKSQLGYRRDKHIKKLFASYITFVCGQRVLQSLEDLKKTKYFSHTSL